MSLSENTTSLQEILDAVNNLPEASGGGGVAKENVSVSISCVSESTSYLPTVFYSYWNEDVLCSGYWTVARPRQVVSRAVALGHPVFITCRQDTTDYGVTSYTASDGIEAVENPSGNQVSGAYRIPAFLIGAEGSLQVNITGSPAAPPSPDPPKEG